MRFFLLLVTVLTPLLASAQSTFLKLYASSSDYDNFNDLVKVSANEYAFITETLLYRVDSTGKILLKKDLKEGQSTFLQSMLVDNGGNCYITGSVFANASTDMVLLKVSSSGQLLLRKIIAAGSTNTLTLTPASNNRIYVCFSWSNPAGESFIRILFLDDQGNEIWKKDLPRPIFNEFVTKVTPTGSMEVVYMTAGDNKTFLVEVANDGSLLETEIKLSQVPGSIKYTEQFCRTPDGGYAFVGAATNVIKSGDALLYKTDKNGVVQWERIFNISLGDYIRDIAPTTDGYILLAEAGSDNSWGSSVSGDIVVMKANWQGDIQWKKAFGSNRTDNASHLLLPDDHTILLGGRVSYPGYSIPIPMLCKLDKDGNLHTSVPFIPIPPVQFKKLSADYNVSQVEKMVKAAVMNNGSLAAAGNFQSRADEQGYPYLFNADRNGQINWYKKITKGPGVFRAVTSTGDGHFMGLIEQEGFLTTNAFTMVKFTSAGDTLWTAPLYTSVLRDVIATSDGGYLLAGGEDQTLSNYDLALVKTDAAGKQLWLKKSGITANWEMGRRVKETPDGDFIVAGNSQVAFDDVSSAYVLKANKNGDVIWTKEFRHQLAVDALYDLIITPANDYIMVGTAGSITTDNRDILLIRTNSKGDVIWEKTYDLHLQDEGITLYYTGGDTILVAGTTGEAAAGKLEKYGFVMKVDLNGKKYGVQYFGQAGVQTSVQQIWAIGQDIMIAGNTQEEYGQGYMYLIPLSMQTVPPPGNSEELSLKLYPNPAVHRTTISMKNNYNGPVKIALFNTAGQQVMVLERTKISAEFNEEVSLRGLSAGIYYFLIQNGTEKNVRRLEIQQRY